MPSGGIAKYPASYGDWCPPPPAKKIDNSFTGAWAYIETVRLLGSMAEQMNNESLVTSLNALYDTLKSDFVSAFYSNSDGHYLDGSLQTSYSLPLHSNIYSGDNMKQTLEKGLVNLIQNTNNGLFTTGILGVKTMFPELSLVEFFPSFFLFLGSAFSFFAEKNERWKRVITPIWQLKWLKVGITLLTHRGLFRL